MSDPREGGQATPPVAENFRAPLKPRVPTIPRTGKRRPSLRQNIARLAGAAATLGAMTFGSGIGHAQAQENGAPDSSAPGIGLVLPQEGIPTLPDEGQVDAPPVELGDVEVAAVVMDARLTSLIAGGEWMDPGAFGDRLFRPAGGPTILLSTDAQAAVNSELASLGMPQDSGSVEKYALGKWGGLLGQVDMSSDPMVIADGGRLLAFQDNKVFQITEAGSTEVQFKSNPYYKAQTRWIDDMGLVATDGYRITHQQINGQWQELTKYIALGTPEQRMQRNLIELTAPLNLNPGEVSQYVIGTKKDGFQSFQILKDSKGEPAIVISKDSKLGLTPAYVDVVNKAFTRLNKIDTNIANYLTVQFGLRAVTGDVPPATTFTGTRRDTYATSFDTKIGTILVNQKAIGDKPLVDDFMFHLLSESRDMTNDYSTVGRFSNNTGLDKATFVENWINANIGMLTPEETDRMTKYVALVRATYA